MPPAARRRTRRPVTLAVVCDQLAVGGQELGMLDLLARIDRRRFTPRVYAFRRGPLADDLRRLNVPVFAGSRSTGAGWTDADARAKVAFRRELARRFRRDRVDLCLVYSWADAVTAAREAGVPAIVERVDGPKLTGWIRDKSSCQRVICESKAIARLLRAQRTLLHCAPRQIAVIPNGVDRGRFDPGRYDRDACRRALGVGSGDFVVGTVARLVAVKNLGHLLEAARLLVDRLGNVPAPRFLIVGPDHGEGAALRRQARRLGVAGLVTFVGAHGDTARVLRAIDVFVLPSIQEGLSFALLEAMSMGLPVIASQVDSIAEVMRDNGYLVSPVDPLRTAIALRELMLQPGLRTLLGARSRQVARRHDVTRMVREYERVLQAAFLEGRGDPRPRRRIAILPSNDTARVGAGHASLRALFERMRRRQADAYWLGLRDGATGPTPSWPPLRRQWYDASPEGRRERDSRLESLRPDLVITDAPRIAAWARDRFPGEEIVLLAPEGDDREGVSPAVLRQVDRLVGITPAARQRIRVRWPRWSWKVCTPEALLRAARPARPGGRA